MSIAIRKEATLTLDQDAPMSAHQTDGGARGAVVTVPAGGSGDDLKGKRSPPDGFLDSVAKLVPGEVLASFWAALQAPGVDGHRSHHLAILLVFAALTPVVLFASARRANARVHWLQYVVRTTAFVLVAVGGDTVLLAWLGGLRWIPSVGALSIIILAAAILAPAGPKDPPRS